MPYPVRFLSRRNRHRWAWEMRDGEPPYAVSYWHCARCGAEDGHRLTLYEDPPSGTPPPFGCLALPAPGVPSRADLPRPAETTKAPGAAEG